MPALERYGFELCQTRPEVGFHLVASRLKVERGVSARLFEALVPTYAK